MSKADDAAHDFEYVVWTRLRRTMPGELVKVETERTHLATDLDCLAGIDAYVKTARGLQTFACRVQWRHYNGNSAPWAKGKAPMSFTCRLGTEVPKRLEAMNNDGLNPLWTLQAYLDRPGGRLECIGWIETDRLYARVQQQLEEGSAEIKENRQDGTRFVVMHWVKDIGGFRWFDDPPHRSIPIQRNLFGVSR